MGKKNKEKVQSLIFDKKVFDSKWMVRAWIRNNSFVIDKRLKRPISHSEKKTEFRVRQKNPEHFNKKTFKVKNLGKGVKGVFGVYKRR